MKHPKKHKDIIYAEDLFKKIIFRQSMAKFNIEGWENDVVLPFLADSDAWLGIWMLRSDELSTALINHRIWDVAYQANSDCLEGMRPVPFDEIDTAEESMKSYIDIPSLNKEEIPYGLRYALCESAFLDSLIVKENKVSIKPIYSFGYDLKKPLEHGDFVPFSRLDVLLAKQQNLFVLDANRKKANDIELSNEQSI